MFKAMKKRLFFWAMLIGLNSPIFAADNIQIIKDTFNWFNQISGENGKPFNEKAVADHFSSDAKMFTNGKLVCQGIAEHYQHFLDLNAHFRYMHVDFDNMDWRQIGNRVYLHYVIEAEDLHQKALKIHVMGYMVIKNNKINLFNEIIHQEMV